MITIEVSPLYEIMEQQTQKWPNVLVLLRHGQSLYNEERELVNRGILNIYSDALKNLRDADYPLSAKGLTQAKKAADFLKKQYGSFDVIFSSPFVRAEKTARIVAEKFIDANFVIEERIREKEFGIADGLTAEELNKFYPREYERKQKEKKYYYRPPGGESYPDVNLRLWSFLNTLVREHARSKVLIVSHSAVMLCFRKLLEKLNEADLLRIDKEDELKNCGIISYRYDPRLKPKPKLKLEFYNKTAN
ncbi:MAG: histidine phosphatase family protein [Candidatus Sungbacteria bacterium]|nr:histidine phosphatase family protein [Candidatus Sungbacteria bacterium]